MPIPNGRRDSPESAPGLLDHAPAAFAVTEGKGHTVIYANASFRAVNGLRELTAGCGIADLFEYSAGIRVVELMDRAAREGSALQRQLVGRLHTDGPAWSCSIWRVNSRDNGVPGLVIELSVATHGERTVSLQREVAERLVLSVLRETDATVEAEESSERSVYLADAGHRLAESLDTDITRQNVAALSLPPLADWCIVDLIEPDESIRRLTIVHRDPHQQAHLDRLITQWAPTEDDDFGVPRMRVNAEPLLIMENAAAALGTERHETLQALQDLGIGPLLTVPLMAGKKVFGAITFVGATRERGFSNDDIELAEGLAARSSVALENARLYAAALLLKDKAEDAAKSATKFIATLSHELRTPINAIFGYVELMTREIHGPVTAEQRTDLERIGTNQRHLMVLINELLNYIRVGSGRVVYDKVPVPLADSANRALQVLELPLGEKNLSCVILGEHAATACADEHAIHQILVNLLSNAIKFTDMGGEITLLFDYTDATTVSVSVSDNGRGIPSDKLDLVFEPFVQARHDDAVHGGIGLGLPISRELARAMDGDLTVESSAGVGSTFTLTLPAEHPSH